MFSPRDEQRIVEVVRHVERTRGGTPLANPSSPVSFGGAPMLAIITAAYSSGYAFSLIMRKVDDSGWDSCTAGSAQYGKCVEVFGRRDVPVGTIVELKQAAAAVGGYRLTFVADYAAVLKVTSATADGGQYNARVLGPTAADTNGHTVAEADFGADPGSDNAIAINNLEIGAATHVITTNTANVTFIFNGTFCRVNSSGKSVFSISGVFDGGC